MLIDVGLDNKCLICQSTKFCYKCCHIDVDVVVGIDVEVYVGVNVGLDIGADDADLDVGIGIASCGQCCYCGLEYSYNAVV